MATGFERGVCRLIDATAPNLSIGRIHPPLMDGVDAFRFPPPTHEGARCHQTAWPCLKFRTIHWNISIFAADKPAFLKDNIIPLPQPHPPSHRSPLLSRVRA